METIRFGYLLEELKDDKCTEKDILESIVILLYEIMIDTKKIVSSAYYPNEGNNRCGDGKDNI